MRQNTAIIINGWTMFAHPLFLDELDFLINKVKELKYNDPVNYVKKNTSKRLAAISRLAFDIIPKSPDNPIYRQGLTLGNEYKHWFRAKFFQQYRLFFRFDSKSKIIIYVWVNDEKNKRAYGSRTDAYKVFKKMLNNGHPPDSWDQLLKEATNSLNHFDNIHRELNNNK